MNQVSSFTVGETYTNDQIRFALDVENLGGIRPALDANRNVRHVAVLTALDDSGKLRAENPYHDRIEGDVLIYTAQGREGDQELKGRNKRLVEQYAVPDALLRIYEPWETNLQVSRALGISASLPRNAD